MIKENYFSDNPDIMLHFEQLFDRETLVNEYEDGFTDAKKYADTGDEKYAFAPDSVEGAWDYYRTVLDSFGDLSGNELSQVAMEMDHTGLKFNDGKVTFPPPMMQMWDKFKEAGLLPYSLKRDAGGHGIPVVMICLLAEIMSRADVSFCMALGMLNLAETIERYSDKEQQGRWLGQMTAGEYTGAMALSEPNFGSDLSSVMTRAEKQEDGTYLLNGTKRFITHACGIGEKPAAILTLARTGKPGSGARGLSFFIVDSKDIEVISIEHKMGIKCSPTCEIAYENTPGEIIGEEGYGLTRYAMGMMNGARLSVATLGVGVGAAAYAEAKAYAAQREQFGKLIQDIPAVKDILQRMEREVAAMRCINLEAGYSIDMYKWRAYRLLEEGKSEREIRKDEQVAYWEKLATLFTPLAKLYCSELANKVAYDGIQVYGGSGFIEEYDMARIYRDARILSIYEGTSQLQVVAAIGGVTAGMSAKGQFRKYLDDMMATFKVTDEGKKMRQLLEDGVAAFKAIEDGEARDMVAAELVWIAARHVNGLLLERTASKLDGDARKQRDELVRQYNIDSLSLAAGNMIRIKVAGGEGAASLAS